MPVSLPVVNLATATFECIFGRGCEGICCKNGRPSIDAKEQARIKKVLKLALPLMRPIAQKLVEEKGHMTNRIKYGHPSLRVVIQDPTTDAELYRSTIDIPVRLGV